MDFMNKSKAIEMSTKTSKIEVIVLSKTILENCMPSIRLGLMKSAGNCIAEKKKQIDQMTIWRLQMENFAFQCIDEQVLRESKAVGEGC